MSGKIKFPRAVAMDVARELTRAVQPLCDRLIFAGSLRRGKAEVGDIELVHIPKIDSRPDPGDLLGNMIRLAPKSTRLFGRLGSNGCLLEVPK